jgi:hypothetical protein
MASVHADTEREVEMHFASPLFREGLGYREDQEAAGFGIQWARGSTPGHVEADLLYFGSDKHDLKTGHHRWQDRKRLGLPGCRRP